MSEVQKSVLGQKTKEYIRREKRKAYWHEYYYLSPEKHIARVKAYNERHKEDRLAYQRRYNASHREQAKAYRIANREREWGKHIERRYGITVQRYRDILATQGGGCAICGERQPTGRAARFHVDHDHKSGEVRGLLCSPCNTGLGAFRDSAENLKRASVYLTNTPTQGA